MGAASSLWPVSSAFSGLHISSRSPARSAPCGRTTLLQRWADSVVAEAAGTASSTVSTVVCDSACQSAFKVEKLRAFLPNQVELYQQSEELPFGGTFEAFKNLGPIYSQAIEVLNYAVGFIFFAGAVYTYGSRWKADQEIQDEERREKIKMALEPDGKVPDFLKEEEKEVNAMQARGRVRTLRKQRRTKKKKEDEVVWIDDE